ncbi:type II toxin-antitoxin system prevent-host-death family antitoxin [bacterium]|nr:type II toxin-antitoxin system prevent-host-death family antitoxin [bacterium]MBU1959007.1 type II toxin-antitoxin system prevent-host-death family antitoxin [bacterium]
MQVFSLTEARNNIKAMFDTVFHDNEEVIIHRKGRESVVVISLNDYNALKETNYLLSSPNNRKHLMESLKQLREGRGQERETY